MPGSAPPFGVDHIRVDPVRSYAAAMPRRMAVGDAESGRIWQWAELDQSADRLAAWLVGELGPASSARVAVLARNHPLQLILQIACARAGAIFVPLNWRLAQAELSRIVADAQPSLLFCDPEFAPQTGSARVLPLASVEALGEAGAVPPATARLGWTAPMTILYTSGTSGLPKGVIVSEANAFWGNANFALGSRVDRNSVFLCDMPMFHTAGLFAVVRVALWAGARVWISAGFDPAKTIARLADRALGITHYFSVPQMAASLWQHPDFAAEKLAGLTMYATGGAPNPKAQVERFVAAGIPLSDGFGMSETGSNFGMPIDDGDLLLTKAGSCGLPFMAVQTRIVDQQGKDVTVGAVGELWIAGPSVTPGYWNKPDLTAAAFVDHWFRTGDMARQDEDGYFYLIDRAKDMFISGGENVYPAEVEAALAELPGVAMAAVIGIADGRWGEVGRAFIIGREGHDLTAETVIAHCRSRLARYKVPASLVFVDSIPMTGSGKVQKHLLPRD